MIISLSSLPANNSLCSTSHNAFFTIQYHQIPIIHASRYYEAFYGSPLRKPPMCLQYAIWAMGSIGTAKYDSYGDVFYKRARQYAETDEMRVRFLTFYNYMNVYADN